MKEHATAWAIVMAAVILAVGSFICIKTHVEASKYEIVMGERHGYVLDRETGATWMLRGAKEVPVVPEQ